MSQNNQPKDLTEGKSFYKYFTGALEKMMLLIFSFIGVLVVITEFTFEQAWDQYLITFYWIIGIVVILNSLVILLEYRAYKKLQKGQSS